MKKKLLAIIVAFTLASLGFAQETIPSSTNGETAVATSSKINVATNADFMEKTVSELAQSYGIDANSYAGLLSEAYGVNVKTNISFKKLNKKFGIEESTANAIANALKSGDKVIFVAKSGTDETVTRDYRLFPMIIGILVLYLLSRLLSSKKLKVISVVNQKKIWNSILLFSFVVSGALGVVLMKKTGFTVFNIHVDAVFWHVVFGMAMLLISITHIIERWYYFERLFKKRRKSARRKKVSSKTSNVST